MKSAVSRSSSLNLRVHSMNQFQWPRPALEANAARSESPAAQTVLLTHLAVVVPEHPWPALGTTRSAQSSRAGYGGSELSQGTAVLRCGRDAGGALSVSGLCRRRRAAVAVRQRPSPPQTKEADTALPGGVK